MWLMLQQAEPDDYVIATGKTHSVRELVEHAFERVGLHWQDYVRVDESLKRGKAELHDLVGDATRARERLGWSPTLDFEGLVHVLVDADLERLRARLERAETVSDA
jgi:GDPmannose 4,6-dehydratase